MDRRGMAFRKMSAEDRIALNSVEPGLAEKIERAVARGKNREQIEKEIFTGLQRKSVDRCFAAGRESNHR